MGTWSGGNGSGNVVLDSLRRLVVVDHQTGQNVGSGQRPVWPGFVLSFVIFLVKKAMKNLNLIFRRTHLYLGMFLVPWIFVYAFSTFMLNHGPVFRQLRPGPDAWSQVWEKNYSASPPESQGALREWAGAILAEHDLVVGAYGVQRNQQRILINAPRFLRPLRVTYRIEEKKLIAEKRDGSWTEALLRLHFRHGYGQGVFVQKIWGFIVDVVCLSFLVWIVTGLYLWWKIPRTRNWGWVAIGAGALSFLGLLVVL